jgi:DNA damage-inducible protein 1
MDTENLIDKNLEDALDKIPESFSCVRMIYVKATINNVDVKMFIDSGAQKSIMPKKMSILCNIEHLIDEKCEGEVAGIGSIQSIVGKIHIVDMQLPVNSNDEQKVEISCGFTVLDTGITLENEEIGIIFGLDMLVSYGAQLDFKKRIMNIHGYEFDFLSQESADKLF